MIYFKVKLSHFKRVAFLRFIFYICKKSIIMARPKKQTEIITDNVSIVQDNVQIETLKEQMELTIELCEKVMQADRSKVLRLKGIKRQLEDVLRKIV